LSSQVEVAPSVVLPSVFREIAAWYAVYTYPRHEKTVTEQLEWKSVEVFLPTFGAERAWKDRKARLQLPLFPGYVFTRIPLSERVKVLATPGVVRILSFNGMPAAIADSEIEAVRICLERGGTLEKHPFLKVGERVRVLKGAFEGLEGIVTRHKNGCKLVVSIDLIRQSVALEIGPELLEPLRSRDVASS
jgi:transcription antitermination factor NusG